MSLYFRFRAFAAVLVAVSTSSFVGAKDPPPWEVGRIVPKWSQCAPRSSIVHQYDSAKSELENGRELAKVLASLQPGDRLVIGPGKYSISEKLSLAPRGTPAAPIWIVAADPSRKPIITRPDARQNVLNLGERSAGRFVCFRNIEFTGGSTLLRLYDCQNVWIDQCHFHHSAAEGITANSHDTQYVFITNNHFHHFENPAATGEAMYLGANHGKFAMSYSVIANNHVHDCGGKQGDGIEVKQGSFNNWIVGNLVHDTQYPCIIAYGTGGRGINMVERNVCYRSGDNVMQIQGEAIVRNNLLIGAAGAAFASTDHQGETRELQVIHNTLIARRRGANLSSWNGREGMVFANNVVYTDGGDALNFPGGFRGVTILGNLCVGSTAGIQQGVVPGRGLDDFVDVRFDGSIRDARLKVGSEFAGKASARFLGVARTNIQGDKREVPVTAGAY